MSLFGWPILTRPWELPALSDCHQSSMRLAGCHRCWDWLKSKGIFVCLMLKLGIDHLLAESKIKDENNQTTWYRIQFIDLIWEFDLSTIMDLVTVLASFAVSNSSATIWVSQIIGDRKIYPHSTEPSLEIFCWPYNEGSGTRYVAWFKMVKFSISSKVMSNQTATSQPRGICFPSKSKQTSYTLIITYFFKAVGGNYRTRFKFNTCYLRSSILLHLCLSSWSSTWWFWPSSKNRVK